MTASPVEVTTCPPPRSAPRTWPAYGNRSHTNSAAGRGYRAGPLRVYWDGAKRRKFDLQVGGGKPFRVPLSASYLDIVGDDAEGALLLAVCPLPDPDVGTDEGEPCFSVTLEGGQTVTVTVALDYGKGGEARAYCVQIAYTDAAAVALQGAGP